VATLPSARAAGPAAALAAADEHIARAQAYLDAIRPAR
jgi:hypothetical protein